MGQQNDLSPLTMNPALDPLQLEPLLQELMKDNPEEAVVKSEMKRVGLKYSKDPVERLNIVFNALNNVEFK